MTVKHLADRASERFEVKGVSWSGDGSAVVQQVAVLPGSGRSALDVAAGRCDALITGDVGYHDAERAAQNGVALIVVPHGDFEWWAMKHWARVLAVELQEGGVGLAISQEWRPPWDHLAGDGCGDQERAATPRGDGVAQESPAVRMWIDGGSRGNPGPSAIGVVIEDVEGEPLESISRAIGITTNNVAEYRALLAGLEAAGGMGAGQVEVVSDSELLVKQMRGEYKVKSEGLKPLHAEARDRARRFSRFTIRHVARDQNARADALVNRALDEEEAAGL
jgi:ribonuclease HI